MLDEVKFTNKKMLLFVLKPGLSLMNKRYIISNYSRGNLNSTNKQRNGQFPSGIFFTKLIVFVCQTQRKSSPDLELFGVPCTF